MVERVHIMFQLISCVVVQTEGLCPTIWVIPRPLLYSVARR